MGLIDLEAGDDGADGNVDGDASPYVKEEW
jgi:hypothetical protein